MTVRRKRREKSNGKQTNHSELNTRIDVFTPFILSLVSPIKAYTRNGVDVVYMDY